MVLASLWERMRQGMSRTRSALVGSIDALMGRTGLTPQTLEALEERLIEADVGPRMAAQLIEALRAMQPAPRDAAGVRAALAEQLARGLEQSSGELALDGGGGARGGPSVVLLVGVNGSGKTTTAGKLAHRCRQQGRRAVLVAADTFRAAAQEQLAVWAERTGATLVRGSPGQDPASVAFDGIQAGRARGADVVLIDTAGRLHNKSQLMAELSKVRRVAERALGRPPDEVLLVLDATTGQNGLAQARVFLDAVQLTGVVLTKLDGTAKGGVAFSVATELHLPLKLVGVGEDPEDLQPFDARRFACAILDVHPPSG